MVLVGILASSAIAGLDWQVAEIGGADSEQGPYQARIEVRSATLLHSSSHAHLFEYDGWLLKA